MSALHTPRPAALRRIHVASALFAVLLVAVLVMRTSAAAFTATTDNPGNLFEAASINLEDNDDGAVLFDVDGLTPGNVEEGCIAVTYTSTGDATADVTLYGSASGDLADHLQITIDYETGVAHDFNDCDGFSPTGSAYSGTLAGFAATHADADSGAASWSVADGDVRTYRFRVEVAADDAAQGSSASADFVWTAQTD